MVGFTTEANYCTIESASVYLNGRLATRISIASKETIGYSGG
ncbi:hypothetical protein NCCP2222_26190 [Sporosarcina sp. NCCP-2222]|nr:hypothetical protein NCCP2222_26190 [Sporosarcina sp. NCCP-2222]